MSRKKKDRIIRSKCCGVERRLFPKEVKKIMRNLEISKEEEEELRESLSDSLGLCPHCSSKRDSRIFHAALQLLKNIYKGMIIVIAIVILFPTLLIVLMLTHVICISDKITLSPILRIREDHREMR